MEEGFHTGQGFEKRNSVITWVDNKPILVVKYGDNYYGMLAICAHMGGCALLTDVNGYVATCPAHQPSTTLGLAR